MPAICPSCKEYKWLMHPTLSEVARDKGHKPVVCENCSWTGEYDDLEWDD